MRCLMYVYLVKFAYVLVIRTDCRCREATLRSAENILRMKRSLDEVPSRICTARWGATPNHIRVLSSPGQRSERINTLRGGTSLADVRS